QPFSEKSRLELGLRADWETDENEFTPLEFDNDLGEYVLDEDLRNDFVSHDKEFSLYSMYRTSFDRLGVQAGLRMEKSVLDGEQRLLTQQYKNDFFNIIPTLNLSYRLKNEDNIKFSYSRSANLPRWR